MPSGQRKERKELPTNQQNWLQHEIVHWGRCSCSYTRLITGKFLSSGVLRIVPKILLLPFWLQSDISYPMISKLTEMILIIFIIIMFSLTSVRENVCNNSKRVKSDVCGFREKSKNVKKRTYSFRGHWITPVFNTQLPKFSRLPVSHQHHTM